MTPARGRSAEPLTIGPRLRYPFPMSAYRSDTAPCVPVRLVPTLSVLVLAACAAAALLTGCTSCGCGCADLNGPYTCASACCSQTSDGCVDPTGKEDCTNSLAPPLVRSVGAPTYGTPPGLAVTTTSDAAGVSPGFTVKFDVMGDTYQTAAASVAIPDAYVFNGFQALGPERTQIGLVGLDFDRDDIVEVLTPLRASAPPTFAYPDLDSNGRYTDGIDPDIEVTESGGMRFIDFLLPFGGDGKPSLLSYGGEFRVHLYIYPGILTNPLVPDDYTFEGLFTAVDPDGGDGRIVGAFAA